MADTFACPCCGSCCCCCIEGPYTIACCDAFYGYIGVYGVCMGTCPQFIGDPGSCQWVTPSTANVPCRNVSAGVCTMVIIPFQDPYSICGCNFDNTECVQLVPGYDIGDGSGGDTTGCPSKICDCA